MADKIKNIKGSLILLLAAFIWGTAFVAQTSGADSVGTFTFNTCRSVVGALFLLLVIVLLDSYGKRTSGGGKDTLQKPYSRTKSKVRHTALALKAMILSTSARAATSAIKSRLRRMRSS